MEEPTAYTSSTIAEAISYYQETVESLSCAEPKEGSAYRSKIARVLVARTTLAHALAISESVVPSPDILSRVSELDKQLKTNAAAIDRIIGSSTLTEWRDVVQPPPSAWWWFLDKHAASAQPKPNPLWTVLAAFFFAAALGLIAEISRRFLSTGADFLGIFATLAQVLLAFLAGSTFTKVGGEWVESVLAHRGIGPRYYSACKSGLAFVVLMIIAAFYLSLPLIARAYVRKYVNVQGIYLGATGQIDKAIATFERAIVLDPDFAVGHYNLGAAYEDVLQDDKAIAEYEMALRKDRDFYPAYNNLARLYIRHRKDYSSALQVLNAAPEPRLDINVREQALVKYSLLKNRGWANLGLQYSAQAELALNEALSVRNDGAAAHCLLAQAYDAEKHQTLASREWELCVAFAPGQESEIEASWLGLAEEHLGREKNK